MTEAEIQALVAKGIKDATPEIVKAATAGIAEAVKAPLAEAMKPVSEGLTALATRVETVEKAAPAPKKDDDKKDAPGAGSAEAIAAAVLKSLEPRLKLVDDLHSERTAEKGAAATRSLVENWLKTKRPNMPEKAREVWAKRLIAANPKDEAALEATFADQVKEQEAMGANVAPFAADYKPEGGKPGTRDDSKENLDAEAKKVREALTTAPRGLI